MKTTNQEWRCRIEYVGEGAKTFSFANKSQLPLSELVDDPLHGRLPGVQLDDLDAVEHFIDHLGPLVLEVHLLDLPLANDHRDHEVHGEQHQHHKHA